MSSLPPSSTLPPRPRPRPARGASAPNVAVTETLICTAQGDPIYQFQCADVLDRVALLQNIAQQATLLSQALPLGKFERLEIRQPDRRTVALFSQDRLVFVSVVNTAVPK